MTGINHSNSYRTNSSAWRSFVVIPARLASTRLPGKLLLSETGQTVLQHTYESAQRATRACGICVAADGEDIAAEVRRFGGTVVLTDPDAICGTDRVIEVARAMPEVDIFVNVQGDEPEISAEAIDLAIELLENNSAAVMSTLVAPIRSWEQVDSPHCVKVVTDCSSRALYFSRSPIPYPCVREPGLLEREPPVYLQHIGVYAYRRDFLLKFAAAPAAMIEQVEKLEQLRVLFAGNTIVTGMIAQPPLEIDTWADYRAFVLRWFKLHSNARSR